MNVEELIIRRMDAGDLDQVHALETRSFPTPWPYKSFEFELKENRAARLWVAEAVNPAEKKIVGMIIAWLLVDEIHIATIAVDGAYRRQKIATQLICTALSELMGQGAVTATLEVRESNTAAQNLYRRFGFQLAGRRPGYYHDNGEAAILMTLRTLDKDHLTKISCLEG